LRRSEKLAALAVEVHPAKREAARARVKWLAAKPGEDAEAERLSERAGAMYLAALEKYFGIAERERLSDPPPP
jgi:hypothetical protein